MSVTQYCNRDVVGIASDASALEAAKLMRKHGTGTLVVVSDEDGQRKPLGLLGESALVNEVMARGTDPESVTAAELMQPTADCAREDEALWTVIERMRANQQRRLPVTDAAGALVGLLAADDILGLLSAGLVDIATLTREPPPAKAAGRRRAASKKSPRKTAKRAPKKEAAPKQEAPAETTQD